MKKISKIFAFLIAIAVFFTSSALNGFAQSDDNGSGRDDSADRSSGRGIDDDGPDNGLRGDGTVDDNLPRHSGLDDNGLRGDGTVDDNLPRHSGLDDNRNFNFLTIRDLNRGMSGDDVIELQKILTAEGVFSGPITGFFGDLTLEGVKKIQIRNNLPETGTVGPMTKEILVRINGVNNLSNRGQGRQIEVKDLLEILVSLNIITLEKSNVVKQVLGL